MSSRYAQGTSVPSEKSRMEIETTLRRYGATSFGYAANQSEAMVAFEANGRRVRFQLPMPDPKERRFTHTPSTDKLRSKDAAHDAWEQGCRQSWRALALCIKAKLEAVEAKITTFEAEFLAHILLPDGRTVGESTYTAIADAYERGKVDGTPLLGKF